MTRQEASDGTLDRLVPRLRDRDEEAFAALYGLLSDALASYAHGLLRDRHLAEDAVQQAFLELVRHAAELRGGFAEVRSWLYTSVRFTCLDRLRSQARRPEQPTADLPEIADPTAVASAIDVVDLELEAALAELTEQQRTALLLRHVSGLSGAEIAEVVGSNRAAVYAMTARAEARLRKRLAGRRIANADGVPPMGAHTGQRG